MMRHEQRIALARSQSSDGINQVNTTTSECSGPTETGSTMSASWRRRARSAEAECEGAASPAVARRRTRHAARLNMGASTDDIHVCIMCMRAIMNNKYGFNMVIQHREAINSIALSLVHHSLRTKALVLELLAAICLVKGGHQIILSAFDNFKEVVGEPRRFHTLMEYFMNYDNFHIEFMAHERMAALEREAIAKLATLESELAAVRAERDQLAEARRQVVEEVSTLRRAQQDSRNRQSMLESKVQELESLTKSLPRGASMGAISSHAMCNGTTNGHSASPPPIPNGDTPTSKCPPPPPPPAPAPPAPPAPPPAAPCPPPPPPPPLSSSAPPPAPPAPGLMAPPMHTDAMTIKRKVDTKYKLPTLNWIALKPNQCEETYSIINHRFSITAISRRKLDTPVEKVIAAINSLDLKQLPLESVEILQRMVPTEAEQKAYKEYVAEKKPINQLTEEDKFLMQLAKVERISAKLSIMSYMGNFFDNIHLITPQIHAIISGSSSVKSSTKLRNVLEIILAFGNYLNSSKRGPAYGFKLQSLDTLMDTKSTDKRVSLLHYIVATIRQNFPELMNFDTELLYIDKAAQVSLENVAGDVCELERGMEQVRREAEARDCLRAAPHLLRDFLSNASDKLRRLRAETKHAQDSFASCVEYFGEAPRGCDANAFFSLLVRFTRAFKQADAENEQRRRLEQAAQQADHVDPNKAKLAQKKQQEAVINELKTKSQAVGEKKLLHQDEVYNGALEDILHGLRSEPYRRADAVRRSHRRRINSHRLSKGLEELDV
ncbi:hypothetical protein HF086_002742 [Spodoptera exigua]|uniref:Formin-like protein n=1 Tax=Spodoptera exigua TaxID=7107 RepID=A0A922M9N3_SPOEX|nr:hypothetical protein HF086_002742 [Spodoptera exigua]